MSARATGVWTAVLGAVLTAFLNMATLAYWGGQVGQHLVDIERRVVRIETWIDRQGVKP